MDAGATTRISDICQRLRRSGRCGDVSNCSSVVQPEDGCCPVCGESTDLNVTSEKYICPLIPSLHCRTSAYVNLILCNHRWSSHSRI